MYKITCDGFPLLNLRDDDLILVNPKLRLSVNTVCEGQFTIYKNHPYYDKLQLLKSVVEVSDEYGVIFRGRATGDTVDINNGMTVDLEGALSYFNDSVVRPFTFPDDFKDDADYQAAEESGNVVAFFLGWLIGNHNSQVQPFQQLHLGNVTVRASNNKLKRFDKEYSTTWETLKNGLFDSELGGYLCIRYEQDGNYVDYLSSFDGTNEQQIVFGENILDMTNETNAAEIYTAIIPLGSVVEYTVETGVTEGEFVDFINTKKIEERVNIKSIADGDVTSDLVKSGDTIYSRSGVVKYGWIYAPTNETTWNDVEDAAILMSNAKEWMQNCGAVNRTIEITAVDLHFTDDQIRSLRMYQNVSVYSEPHGISDKFQISMLEIDLLNPQKTGITLGQSVSTLADRNVLQKEDLKKNNAALKNADERIRLQVQDDLLGLTSSIDIALGEIALEVQGVADEFTRLAVTLDGVTITDASGTTKIKGSSIETDSLVLTGMISWGDLDSSVQNTINSAGGISASQAASIASTTITKELVESPTIKGAYIYGGGMYDLNGNTRLVLNPTSSYMKNADLCLYSGDNLAFQIYDDIAGNIQFYAYSNHYMNSGNHGTFAFGEWDFNNATVTGLNVVFG